MFQLTRFSRARGISVFFFFFYLFLSFDSGSLVDNGGSGRRCRRAAQLSGRALIMQVGNLLAYDSVGQTTHRLEVEYADAVA